MVAIDSSASGTAFFIPVRSNALLHGSSISPASYWIQELKLDAILDKYPAVFLNFSSVVPRLLEDEPNSRPKMVSVFNQGITLSLFASLHSPFLSLAGWLETKVAQRLHCDITTIPLTNLIAPFTVYFAPHIRPPPYTDVSRAIMRHLIQRLDSRFFPAKKDCKHDKPTKRRWQVRLSQLYSVCYSLLLAFSASLALLALEAAIHSLPALSNVLSGSHQKE